MLTLNRNGASNTSRTQQVSSSVISETGNVSSPAFSDNQSTEGISTKILHIESMLNEAAIEPYLIDGQGRRTQDIGFR